MDRESSEIVILLNEIKKPLRKDWGIQRAKGEREAAISFDKLQSKMHDKYPEILSESTFKTAYIYLRIIQDGGKRAYSLKRLEAVLRFFYVDIATKSGWPNTTAFLKEFAKGKYFHIIKDLDNTRAIGDVIDAVSKVGSDAINTDSDADLYLQILQIASRVKAREMNHKSDREAKEEVIKKLEAERSALKEDLIKLEALLSTRKGGHEEIISEIADIKQKMG